jgi:large subunit ribosomal protein L21
MIKDNMYAIIDFNGSQYKIEKNSKLYVNRLETPEGESIEIGKILLIDNDGDVQVGTPTVEGAKVTAKVIEHLKGDKVIVFKKKRRKGYKVKNGHRQYLTRIQIEEIIA